MSSRLNPYISFRDNARDAFEFYRSVFGGELSISTFGEGMGDANAPGADKIMHAMLETADGYTLMGADTPPGMEYDGGSSISVSLSGDDQVLRDHWQKLSQGGTVTMPLEKQVWGDEFGMCTDQFGISWMVNIAGQQG